MNPRRSATKKRSRSGSTRTAKRRKNSKKTDDVSDRWLEIGVECDPAAGDAVAERLGPYGEGGAVVEARPEGPARFSEDSVPVSVWVRIYLPAAIWDCKRADIERMLRDLRKDYFISDAQTRELGPEDWTEEWKKGYETRKVGRRLVIVPSWKKYSPEPDEVVVTMDPGMAFGTGLHPTTRLCLIGLGKYLETGDHVLDVGTGSGILAIAAVKLGAGPVTAFDIEATAVEIAKQNAIQNRVSDRVTLHTGSLQELATMIQPANLIAVNILAYTIIKMLPDLKAKLLPGGRLVTSGILSEFRGDVETALKQEEFEVVEALQDEDWVALVARVRAS